MVQFYKATLALCSYLILSESSIYIAESPVNVETNAVWLTVRSFPRWPAHPFRANRQVSGSKLVEFREARSAGAS